MIDTTHGVLDEATLVRVVGVEDAPTSFTAFVVWYLDPHDGSGCPVCAAQTTPRLKPMDGRVEVRRDAACWPKVVSVESAAIAAAIV